MKNLLVLILLVFSCTIVKAQTIDTTITNFAACKIVPFKAKFTDTVNVTHLSVRITLDNLKNICNLTWQVFYIDSTAVNQTIFLTGPQPLLEGMGRGRQEIGAFAKIH